MLFVFSNNLVSTDTSEHELRVHSGFAKSRNVSADTKNWKITELFVSFLHVNLYRYWKHARESMQLKLVSWSPCVPRLVHKMNLVL